MDLFGFKSLRLDLTKHGSSFRDMHSVANDQLKLDNAIKACLINLSIILYNSFSLNIHEYQV